MSQLAAQRPAPVRAPERQTVWGHDAREILSRFWLACGMTIARRGVFDSPLPVVGPYLLLDEHQLVMITPDAVRSLLASTGTRHLHVVSDDATNYRESVCTDETGAFEAIRRSYSAQDDNPQPITLTDDRTLAAAWIEARDDRLARLVVRQALGFDRCKVQRVAGSIWSATDPDAMSPLVGACLVGRGESWPGAADMREIRPGVWAHESAIVDPKVSVVGPVWIGSGQVLLHGDVVVGPCVLEDAYPPERPVSLVVQATCRDASSVAARRDEEPAPLMRGERVFNVAVAIMGLLLTAPLYPLIMALIWLEDGRPWFFGHRRQTLKGREFNCLKFRTMRRDAEQLKKELATGNASDGPHFHMTEDPRLLRVGRWLRRFHLDELPQLINVLRGEMNLVGPRPSPDRENQYCPRWREARLSVRPGITGLWQVCRTRRPGLDFQEWIRFDLEYLRRRSWRLDLWILMMTFVCVLRPGAPSSTSDTD